MKKKYWYVYRERNGSETSLSGKITKPQEKEYGLEFIRKDERKNYINKKETMEKK